MAFAPILTMQAAQAEFIQDSKAEIDFKNYYFDQDQAPSNKDSTVWGQGIELSYQSGFTEGPVGFGLDATAAVGIRLDGSQDKAKNSLMFPLDDDGAPVNYWTRAFPTVKARYQKTDVRVGELRPNLPILSRSFARLLESAYLGGQVTSKDVKGLTLTGGYVTKAIPRASKDTSKLSIKGATETSDGFLFGGADWKPNKNLTLQYYAGELDDFYVQQFVGVKHKFPLSEHQSFNTDLRLFDTQATGANKRGEEGYGAKVDNQTASVDFKYKFKNHQLQFGAQQIGDDGDFLHMNQGSLGTGADGTFIYLPTNRLLQNFTNAGEKSTWYGYRYDFNDQYLKGLNISFLKVEGRDFGKCGCATESEIDYTLRYKVPEGKFKNLGFTAQYGKFKKSTGTQQEQTRIYMTYTLPLF
ncbi:OprD family outer membrane porin [Acinetobacter sp.]|jgi:hypothetical protein|uniref:OprD family outer membrane porin n=1 Tax=Acinetobacter sp. TaxID=472 RepID=UPI0035B3BDC7